MKKIGAIFLVAGTCIGSGMIALPLVLSKLGLILSAALMLFMWFFVYYTSLISIELNLQAGTGLSIGELGRRFSGRTAETVGVVSLKLLSYSLLAVYIYGGASIIQELLVHKTGIDYSFYSIASCFAFGSACILLFSIRFIDYCNRILFISLLGVVALLIVGLTLSINWTNLPLLAPGSYYLSSWSSAIPVVFTSFGFQVIFHTMTNYCKGDPKVLKQAFFWGSLIPALIYLVWTCSVLSVVYHQDPSFFDLMMQGKVEVGELIQVLSSISQWQSVRLLVWFISLLAIITSAIGVGIGLFQSLKTMMPEKITCSMCRSIVASIATILPPYLAVLYIPNAFISVLGFAGMILAIIAVLLPIYLFYQIRNPALHYKELRSNGLIYLSFLIALIVIVSELNNMI